MKPEQAMEWFVGQVLEGRRLGGWTEGASPARDASKSAMSDGNSDKRTDGYGSAGDR